MSDIVIRCEGLGKKYRIGASRNGRYVALRDVLAERFRGWGRRLLGRASGKGDAAYEDIWALKDVSFEVKRGECVGIIGRNGAGKSTLLKLLSRITEPTEGRIRLRGRVASLLEVGTGFHPELTGRENIYLNGAILGMKRAEIRRKFDEIVAFAEVEKFIETPVKHYSSGMYMRLAFAVAAHLEPEILLIDEVLAVGDAQFQKKCLGKMGEVAMEGRTVLFVSHNMQAITQLCPKCTWIAGGRVNLVGDSSDVVDAYLQPSVSQKGNTFSPNGVGDGSVSLLSYFVRSATNESLLPATNEDIVFEIRVIANQRIRNPAYGISISNERGVLMTCLNTVEKGDVHPPLDKGETTVRVTVRRNTYLPGRYRASFWVMNPQGHIFTIVEDEITFEIRQTNLYGVCQVDHRWGCVYADIGFSSL